MFQACLDREILSGSIGAGLAARHYFSKHFEKLVAFSVPVRAAPINPLSGSRSEWCSRVSEDQNEALSLCPYKRGVRRAPCQKRKISTVRRDSATR